jgi:hypothetical protein
VLQVALEELDVPHAGIGSVRARELEHLVGHVKTDRATCGADAAGADQHVRTRPGAKVQDRLALVQVGDRSRHAAAERRLQRSGVRAAGFDVVAEIGAEAVRRRPRSEP